MYYTAWLGLVAPYYHYRWCRKALVGDDPESPESTAEDPGQEEQNPTFEMEHPNAPPGVHAAPPAYGDAPGVSDTTLPAGWSEAVDPSSGDIYYYNEDTEETRWERPGCQA